MAALAKFHSAADLIAHWSDPAQAEKFNASLRWNGKTRRDYRPRMFSLQGGACVKCGDQMLPVPDGDHAPGCECSICHGNACKCPTCMESCEFSHLVPATFHGESRRGWIMGNVTLWHRRCNRLHGERLTRVEDLARPDLVAVQGTRSLPKY